MTGRINGRILSLGADWQTIFSHGLAELDTRYAFEMHDGALIEIMNYGLRHGPEDAISAIARGEDVDPGTYCLCTHALLETGDPRYDWVNNTLFVGSGTRQKKRVQIDLYEVL